MDEIAQQVEVLTDPARVWVIAGGQYEDRTPVAVVEGTEDDAERYAEHYNAMHSCAYPDRAYVWVDVELIRPRVQ